MKDQKHETMLLMMKFDTDTCLDNMKHCRITRHTNHSCNPNFCVETWGAHFYLRAGSFAKCNVTLGEELTIDYQYDMSHTRKFAKCHFMSKNCRGNIEFLLKIWYKTLRQIFWQIIDKQKNCLRIKSCICRNILWWEN